MKQTGKIQDTGKDRVYVRTNAGNSQEDKEKSKAKRTKISGTHLTKKLSQLLEEIRNNITAFVKISKIKMYMEKTMRIFQKTSELRKRFQHQIGKLKDTE